MMSVCVETMDKALNVKIPLLKNPRLSELNIIAEVIEDERAELEAGLTSVYEIAEKIQRALQ